MLLCPVCGSFDTRLFMHGIYDSDTTDVLECASCGMQFLSPQMSDDEEDKYYSGYYSKQNGRRFREMHLRDQQEQSFRHYEQYKDVYLSFLQGCSSILEIGCGTGGFLRFVQAYCPSIRIVATERCVENIAFIRECFGENYIVDDVEALGSERFDRVLAFGVFEHLRDSRGFLHSMKQRLHINGRLVLKVPNKANVLVDVFGLEVFKRFMYMKQHYYTFTEHSFELLARQTGYSILGFEYVQAWGLDNHLSWLRYHKPRDFSDMTRLLSLDTIRAYNQDLIDRKVTDTFMAILSPVTD